MFSASSMNAIRRHLVPSCRSLQGSRALKAHRNQTRGFLPMFAHKEIIAEKEKMIMEKDAKYKSMIMEKEKMIMEKEKMIMEKEKMITEKDETYKSMIIEKEKMITEKEKMITEKDKQLMKEERAYLVTKSKYEAIVNLRPIIEHKVKKWYNVVHKKSTNTTAMLDRFHEDVAKTHAEFEECVKFVLKKKSDSADTPSKKKLNDVKERVKKIFSTLSSNEFGHGMDNTVGFVVGGKLDDDTRDACSAFLAFFNVPHTVKDSSYEKELYTYLEEDWPVNYQKIDCNEACGWDS